MHAHIIELKKTEGNNYIKMAITSLFFFKVVIVTSEEWRHELSAWKKEYQGWYYFKEGKNVILMIMKILCKYMVESKGDIQV